MLEHQPDAALAAAIFACLATDGCLIPARALDDTDFLAILQGTKELDRRRTTFLLGCFHVTTGSLWCWNCEATAARESSVTFSGTTKAAG